MTIATTLPMEKLERVPDLKPGVYADGLPLNEVQYLQCKLILRPNKFDSRKRPSDFLISRMYYGSRLPNTR
jgi:hypothetical protein